MKGKIITSILFLSIVTSAFGQTIKRIDGTIITVDRLESKIQFLMKNANLASVAVSVFNENKPIFRVC